MTHRHPPGSWLVAALLAAAVGTTTWRWAGGGPLHASAVRTAVPVDMRIDLNRAGAAELNVLPGIGPRLAERIIADRRRNGPFASLDDLTRVRGIGPRTVERIRPLAVAGRPVPDFRLSGG